MATNHSRACGVFCFIAEWGEVMWPVMRSLLIAAVVILASHRPAPAQSQFKGEIVATLLSDGRNMKLVQPFGYIDSNGQVWEVPAGAETDGASIPGVFWLTHPPFT